MVDPVANPILDILQSPEPHIVDYFYTLLWTQLATGTCDIGDHYVEKIERRRTYHLTSTGIQHEFLLAHVKSSPNGSLATQKTYLVVERSGALGQPRPQGYSLMSNPRCARCEPDLLLSMYRSLFGLPSGREDTSCEAVDTIQVLPDEFSLWMQSTCIAHVEFPAPGYSGSPHGPTEYAPMPEISSDPDAKRFPLYFYQLCLMAKRIHAQYKTWDASRMNCHFYCATLLHLTRLATRCPLVLRINPQTTTILRWIDDPGCLDGSDVDATRNIPDAWRSRSWSNALIAWLASPFVSIKDEPSNELLRPLVECLHKDISESEPQASKLRRKVVESGRWNAEQRRWLRDLIWLLQEKARVMQEVRVAPARTRTKAENDAERLAAQIMSIVDTRHP